MFLVVARAPSDPALLRRAAELAGLVLADIAQRLVAPLPRVLLVDARGAAFERIAAALAPLGFVTFTCDPATAPSDDDRIVASAVSFDGPELVVTSSRRQRHACPGPAISLIQQGVRFTLSPTTTTTTERRLDLPKAVLSGGLLLTKKVARTSTLTTEEREPFLLIQRADGEDDIVLYERRLDYRGLGAEMAASSRANLDVVGARLRTLAPHAPVDDTAARPGFVTALPLSRTDAVDLALHLVALSRRVLAGA